VAISDFSELGLMAAVAVVVIDAARTFRLGPKFVLTECVLDEAAASSPVLLLMRGRQGGLWAALLSKLGVGQTVELRITREDLTIEKAGLWGFTADYAPLAAVQNTTAGFYRAFGVLIVSLGVAIYGVGRVFLGLVVESRDSWQRLDAAGELRYRLVLCLVVSAGLYLWYVLSKRVHLDVRSGGRRLGLSFCSSLLDMESTDAGRALAAAALMNRAVMAAHRKDAQGDPQ